MTELAKRVITAVVGIPLFLVALVGMPPLTGALTWTALVMLIALIACVELLTAVEQRFPEVKVNRLVAALAVYLPLEAWLLEEFQPVWLPTLQRTMGTALLLALGWEVWRAERTARLTVWRNVGFAALIALYLGMLLSMWVRLRQTQLGCGAPWAWLPDGVRLVLLVCATVWSCDTVAYFVGKRIGRHRLAPHLSPHKSWEGAIAGLVVSALVSVAVAFPLWISWQSAAVLGLAAGVAGQVGDLFESALKRELQVKDLGFLLPGHGGVIDRFDSLLFALPVVYLLAPLLPTCP